MIITYLLNSYVIILQETLLRILLIEKLAYF